MKKVMRASWWGARGTRACLQGRQAAAAACAAVAHHCLHGKRRTQRQPKTTPQQQPHATAATQGGKHGKAASCLLARAPLRS